MLTDIFATRYAARQIWDDYREPDRILVMQIWRIVREQVLPYYTIEGKVNDYYQYPWKSLESRLSMELGLKSLSPPTYGYYDANKIWRSGTWSLDYQCEQWVTAAPTATTVVDRYMKERISFVELAFRLREEMIKDINDRLEADWASALAAEKSKPRPSGAFLPGSRSTGLKNGNKVLNDTWEANKTELNTRFQQAKVPLSYHNGFIQIVKDDLIEDTVAKPFWKLTAKPTWKNVDTDMKEAVDRRDSNDRDPAFYALRALESALKIISDKRGFSTGAEKSATHYIDNLVSAKNGRMIEVWEGDQIRALFTHVRNPLSHGPGSKEMPALSQAQTDWVIETAMSWTRNLISRLASP